jgi:hypothetical protein
MGLFTKKETVPEIPSAPSLPELPDSLIQPEKKSLPELPSFPINPKNEDLNQEMVKSAVADQSTLIKPEGEQGIPDFPKASIMEGAIPPKPFPTPEAPTFPTPNIPSEPRVMDSLPSVAAARPAQTNEPIFVRIDKFQASQENFNDIGQKISEIESVLQKIKEVKIREEEELKGWTEDVEKIKLKLGEIDSDIFSQI